MFTILAAPLWIGACPGEALGISKPARTAHGLLVFITVGCSWRGVQWMGVGL